MSDIDWSTLRQIEAAKALLGCQWGNGTVTTPDDTKPCHAQAKQIAVLYANGVAFCNVRLCEIHLERLNQETTPHEF